MHYYGLPDWTENRGRHIVEICAEAVGGGDICPLKGGNASAYQGTDPGGHPEPRRDLDLR